jgi:hypothetical protein
LSPAILFKQGSRGEDPIYFQSFFWRFATKRKKASSSSASNRPQFAELLFSPPVLFKKIHRQASCSLLTTSSTGPLTFLRLKTCRPSVRLSFFTL